MQDRHSSALRELQVIPGVGDCIAEDLWDLNVRSLDDLKARDPEQMYQEVCRRQGHLLDRSLLYVFRCAVYYANHTQHDHELLKWWKWKDHFNAAPSFEASPSSSSSSSELSPFARPSMT
jgi:hypothetical protein